MNRAKRFWNDLSIRHKMTFGLVIAILAPMLALSLTTRRDQERANHILVAQEESILLEQVRTAAQESVAGRVLLIDQKFDTIEDELRDLQSFAAYLYANPQAFGRYPYPSHYERHPTLGFYWTPQDEGNSTLFVSSRTAITPQFLEEQVYLSEHLDPLLKAIYEHNDNVVSVYINTEQNLNRLYPWYNVEEVIDEELLPPDYDIHDPDFVFYWLATAEHNPEGDVVWTDVYLDPVGRGWMVSGVAPVYLPDGQLVGVVGVDVTIDQLITNVLEAHFQETNGYAFLLGPSGQVIAVPERGKTDLGWEDGEAPSDLNLLTGPQTAWRGIAAQMIEGETGQATIQLGAEEKYVFFAPVPATDWSLGLVIPAAEAATKVQSISTQLEDLRQQHGRNIILSIVLGAAIVLLLTQVTARRVLGPLSQATQTALAIADGRLNELLPVKGNDELGTLARAFNRMSQSLQDREEKLADQHRELEATNETLHQVNQRLLALQEASTWISGSLSLDDVLLRITESARIAFGGHVARVWIVNPDDNTLESTVVPDTFKLPPDRLARTFSPNADVTRLPIEPGRHLLTDVLLSRQPLFVADMEAADIPPAYAPEWRGSQKAMGARGIALVPLMAQGEAVGLMGIARSAKAEVTPEERNLLMAFASHAGIAIQNAHLFENLRRKVRELSGLNQIVAAVTSTLNLDQLLGVAAEQIVRLFGIGHCGVGLFNEDYTALHIVAEYPVRDALGTLMPTHQLPTVQGIVTRREPIVIDDVLTDERVAPVRDLFISLGIRSMLLVPLIAKDRILGSIGLDATDQPHTFTPDEVALAQTVAGQVAIAIENARLYEQERQMVEQLREVDRLKSEFMANMSHELRTPLNAIIGFSAMLLDDLGDMLSEEQQDDLEAINESGYHLLNLINDVLDLAKIEAGRMELSKETLDLREVVNNAMTTAQALIGQKPVTIVIQLPPNLPPLVADHTRLQQVILNLVSNAIKFTEKGTITLQATVQDGEIVISVSDTGIGIAAEDLPIIFEEFRQVDGSSHRRYGGTGLGLPITKKLVEMHGGRIWVESQVGVGSTFYVALPLHLEPEAEAEADRSNADPT